MKKLLSFLTLIILISACSSDNTTTAPFTEVDLIETWNVVELYSENSTASGTINGINITGDAIVTGSNFNAQVTFTDNPKNVTLTGSLTLSATINVSGLSQTFEQVVDQIPNINGNWNLANNIINITESGESTDFSIISYSNNTLKLKSTVNNYEFNFQGANTLISGDMFITLQKL